MTKQEIKYLVAAKIAGQGTQVDLGGALPTIIDAIIDAIPEGGASPVAPEPAITINASDLTEASYEEAATTLGITVEELRSLPNQLVVKAMVDGEGELEFTRTYYQKKDGVVLAGFGSAYAMSIRLGGTVNFLLEF